MRNLWFGSRDDDNSFLEFMRAICPSEDPTWTISDFGIGVMEFFGDNDRKDGNVLLLVDSQCEGYRDVITQAIEEFGRHKLVVVALVPLDKPPLKRCADLTIRSILIDQLNGTDGSSDVARQVADLFARKSLQQPATAI